MQRLEVSGAVRPIYGSLGVKRLISWMSKLGGKKGVEVQEVTARDMSEICLHPAPFSSTNNAHTTATIQITTHINKTFLISKTYKIISYMMSIIHELLYI